MKPRYLISLALKRVGVPAKIMLTSQLNSMADRRLQEPGYVDGEEAKVYPLMVLSTKNHGQ